MCVCVCVRVRARACVRVLRVRTCTCRSIAHVHVHVYVDLHVLDLSDGVYRTILAGLSMYCTLQYPGSWSVFVNGQGMNVFNVFSGNNSQGFQGTGGSTASASSSSTAPPDPRSSALATSVTRLPASSCGTTILNDDTLVSNRSEH